MNQVIVDKNLNKVQVALHQIKQIIITYLEGSKLSPESLDKIKNSNIFDIPELTHGDYTTNVAMTYAKELKMNPRELAEKLIQPLHRFAELPQGKHLDSILPLGKVPEAEGVESRIQFEVAGAGFINIRLGDEIRLGYLKEIFDKKDLPFLKVNSKWTDKKVLIEYTDPNPFKIFHIGHLVQNTAGESASRLLDIGGANLRRLCYQGDVGMHVAKTIWGMRHLNKDDFKNYTEWYNAGYVYGSTKWTEAENNIDIEESQNIIREIKDLNKDIYKLFIDNDESNLKQEYENGYIDSMKQFKNMYELLGTKFDDFIRESLVANICLPIVKDNTGENKIFIKSDGAIVNDVNVTGMHTRVFVNSQGLPTYEAKDIGNFQYKLSLAKELYNESTFDYSIVSTGNEIDDYFKLINKVIDIIYPEYKGKQIHISNGMLRLTSGKMSSRKGSVVPATEMIDDMEQAILEKSSDRDSSELEDPISNVINTTNKYKYLAINAFKFNFLKQAMGKDVIYDREKAIDVNGDSGMYVNYTYARLLSLFNKAKEINISTSSFALENKDKKSKAINDIENIERIIIQYDYITNRAVESLHPHHMAQYSLSLCHEINRFYNDNKVLDESKSKEEIAYILTVLDTGSMVLKSIMYALGMRAVESV